MNMNDEDLVNLVNNVDIAEKQEEEEEEEIVVIKKRTAYSYISNYRFKFLDVINYLAPGVNYSKFLKAYHAEESKSYFPYEWFDSTEKLNHPCLPPYEAFWSELKKRNTLEEGEEKSGDGAEKKRMNGQQNYQTLKAVWLEKKMTTFKDFLIYYNNLDVGPFVTAVENMQVFYFEKISTSSRLLCLFLVLPDGGCSRLLGRQELVLD